MLGAQGGVYSSSFGCLSQPYNPPLLSAKHRNTFLETVSFGLSLMDLRGCRRRWKAKSEQKARELGGSSMGAVPRPRVGWKCWVSLLCCVASSCQSQPELGVLCPGLVLRSSCQLEELRSRKQGEQLIGVKTIF